MNVKPIGFSNFGLVLKHFKKKKKKKKLYKMFIEQRIILK